MDEDGFDSSRIRLFWYVTDITLRWNVVQWRIVDLFELWSLDLIEEFIAFELYRRPPDPLKCIVEEVGPNSGSDDKHISH